MGERIQLEFDMCSCAFFEMHMCSKALPFYFQTLSTGF